MKLIEIETKMGKDGMIKIPEKELLATGLKEGDKICLLYLEQPRATHVDEFLLERIGDGDDLSK